MPYDMEPEVTELQDDFSEAARHDAIEHAESMAINADLAAWSVTA